MRTNTMYRIQHDNRRTVLMLHITHSVMRGQCNIVGVSLYIHICQYASLCDSVIYKGCHYVIMMAQRHVIDESKTGIYASKTHQRCIAYLRAVYNSITKYNMTNIQPDNNTTSRRFNMTITV